MPLTDVQLRRMESDYLDLDTEQRVLLVGNALRVMPNHLDPNHEFRQKLWYARNPVTHTDWDVARINRFPNRPNPITSVVAFYALNTNNLEGEAAVQFFENLYEQTTGPLDVDPPPRRPPAPAPPPPEIRVRRSVLGWNDPITSDTINTGHRVIRLHHDDRMIFDEQELLIWFNKHPGNPTNPLTRQAAPPSEREAGVAVVEEDAGPPPPAGGRRRRRRTLKGRKARKATRRRR